MKKNKLFLALVGIVGILAASCSDDQTYADQKKRERSAIESFLSRDIAIKGNEGDTLIHVGRINVITEEQFREQDSTTNVAKNEYVYFGSNGIYMQIVRKGEGQPIQSGETKTIYTRFTEYNIMGDSLQLTNKTYYWISNPDVFTCTNTYGTLTASFTTGLIYSVYGSASVPGGWLVPLSYVNIGRQENAETGVAKVRVIVPHSQGHQNATSNVYPCFYELEYMEGR